MDKIVGVLGGGQLGRMLAAEASLLNVKIVFLDVGPDSPAKQIVNHVEPFSHIDGSFTDPKKIFELASKCDVLTVEIEHVDANVLEEVQRRTSVEVHPSPKTIKIIQDKYLQKEHLHSHRIPIPDYKSVESTFESLEEVVRVFGLPFMLKSRTLAYDGRGNFAVRSLDRVPDALSALANRPLYAERWVPFMREIAVLVVRSADGKVLSYPAVETVHRDNICHLVFCPLRGHDAAVEVKARKVAEDTVKTFSGAGIFAVEMFQLEDGSILVNEVAPRPHNSGHHTIESSLTSQFSNHLRAILSLPLGSTSLKVGSTVMLNLIGTSPDMSDIKRTCANALATDGASVHLYGKSECRKGRKMGHITVVGDSDAEVRNRLRPLLQSQSTDADNFAPPRPPHGHSSAFPLVSIIMGSDSDLPVMLPAAKVLESFGIPIELSVVSAHRTPDRLVSFSKLAASRGLRVVIAGAGGAAHLPGMVAALTSLPVIGVPVKGSSLDGVDSLYSIVQMPRGIPVATVAINNGMNAGLLAVRILAASDVRLQEKMDAYLAGLEGEVMGKVKKLEEVGWEDYKIIR